MSNGIEKQRDRFAFFVKSESVENAVEFMLFQFGFKSNLQGTGFLKDAIVENYTTKIRSLSKGLYPRIAVKHDSTAERVERSIRHTINECFSAGNLVRANDLLGFQIISNYPPTNSEFISSICTWLRLERMPDFAGRNVPNIM